KGIHGLFLPANETRLRMTRSGPRQQAGQAAMAVRTVTVAARNSRQRSRLRSRRPADFASTHGLLVMPLTPSRSHGRRLARPLTISANRGVRAAAYDQANVIRQFPFASTV